MATEANGDLAQRWHKPTRVAAKETARLITAVVEMVLAAVRPEPVVT